eukprot:CAMPEP_0113953722 /NCGR_PEP_ID=MMETSP0011_2-20120614/2_1 /TAXON_ID=101924 /ORGANISM="Rhodosorus marinus" /LENGTH=265 /DNA_ID=CAMNT_0000962465 /DNA_START=265 /DNA_END=1062 /DNA_ORIENTATION=- /assembly_acc=CAM_ASM_000156
MATHPRPQTLAIIGFGNFGQFLAKTFVRQGHRVLGQSRSDYSTAAKELGAEYFKTADEVLDQNPDVVILCTSIMSLKTVMKKFPLQRLEDCLVVDVCSVKEYPRDLMMEMLPPSADILCTHPMFGPESGKHSWKDLPFVYDVVRVCNEERQKVVDDFVLIWELEQCSMVPMTSKEHDSFAASTQFITHTTGRMLAGLNLTSTPIDTKGYESLLGVIDTTIKDSFDLYYGLYRYNYNSKSEIQRLEDSLRDLRMKLEEEERNDQDQ